MRPIWHNPLRPIWPKIDGSHETDLAHVSPFSISCSLFLVLYIFNSFFVIECQPARRDRERRPQWGGGPKQSFDPHLLAAPAGSAAYIL